MSSVSSVNATEAEAKRAARHPLQWILYLTAIGIATIGWIAFLAYCALVLLRYWEIF